MHLLMHPLVTLGLLIVALPPAIALVIPVRRLPLLVGWLAMVVLSYLAYPAGLEHSAVKPFVILAMLIAFATIALIKIGSEERSASAAGPAADENRCDIGASSPSRRLPIIATGIFAGQVVVYLAAMTASVVRPTWLALAPVIVIPVVLWMLAPRIAARFRAGATTRQFVGSIGPSAVITCAAVVLWIAYSIGGVIESAEAAAGERPYCIHVPAGFRSYVPATAQLDFSPQTMRTSCMQGTCLPNHAILVVADGSTIALWNWSYQRKAFLPGFPEERAASILRAMCSPRPHFARDLPLM